MSIDADGNRWEIWAKYVLETIKEIKIELADVAKTLEGIKVALANLCNRKELQAVKEGATKDMQAVKDDVLKLKIQAGIWGGLLGFAAGVVSQMIVYLIKSAWTP